MLHAGWPVDGFDMWQAWKAFETLFSSTRRSASQGTQLRMKPLAALSERHTGDGSRRRGRNWRAKRARSFEIREANTMVALLRGSGPLPGGGGKGAWSWPLGGMEGTLGRVVGSASLTHPTAGGLLEAGDKASRLMKAGGLGGRLRPTSLSSNRRRYG